MELLDALGLNPDEVGDASAQRNTFAALQRTINALVLLLMPHLEKLSPQNVERLGKLLRGYRDKYKTEMVLDFVSWTSTIVRKRSVEKAMRLAALAALMSLNSDLADVREQREAMNKMVAQHR